MQIHSIMEYLDEISSQIGAAQLFSHVDGETNRDSVQFDDSVQSAPFQGCKSEKHQQSTKICIGTGTYKTPKPIVFSFLGTRCLLLDCEETA